MLACGFALYNLGTAKVMANLNESERKLLLTEDLAGMDCYFQWVLSSQGNLRCLKEHLQNLPYMQP